ncbi:MAG TPA: isocitrate lyase/phosphoenolpyruvate mutase family protein [Acidobacteriaceae bacterium]|jgi:2-methylisocitrate lyase-like PEP mutase family enzyme|nr:isocitrate lyase/phosphoenolpyruvate mutase family protein [Acidobacteriaceae bacterium]
MSTQQEKGSRFRALHQRESAFIIPNPWDTGTARLLTRLGFEALATTSAGYAFSAGLQDGAVGRDAMLAHVSQIVAATDLPVSADLENGFGDTPEACAETIRLAAATGLAGGSIEDVRPRPEGTLYSIDHAVERVRAAAEAARALPAPFVLTARAENFIAGNPDLADTIRRLQAFQEVGADVLYAPGLATKEDIATLLGSVDRPINVLMPVASLALDFDDLSAMGVRRISVGSALSRVALTAFLRAAEEMQLHGTFSYANHLISYKEFNDMFEP